MAFCIFLITLFFWFTWFLSVLIRARSLDSTAGRRTLSLAFFPLPLFPFELTLLPALTSRGAGAGAGSGAGENLKAGQSTSFVVFVTLTRIIVVATVTNTGWDRH